MAFAANVSKPKTISKTRAGSIRTVELKGPLPKAMNIGDGNREKDEYIVRTAVAGLNGTRAAPPGERSVARANGQASGGQALSRS